MIFCGGKIIWLRVNHTPKAGNFAANKNNHNSGIESPIDKNDQFFCT